MKDSYQFINFTWRTGEFRDARYTQINLHKT
jgi:hypothetical protein